MVSCYLSCFMYYRYNSKALCVCKHFLLSLFSHEYFSMSKCNISMKMKPTGHHQRHAVLYAINIFCLSYTIDYCLYTQISPIQVEQLKIFSIKTIRFFFKTCKWPTHVWYNTLQSWIHEKDTH